MPAATAAALNNGIVTSSIKRRNDFLMPVFDDGTGEPEIGGHSKRNLAFRKGRLGVAQYMQDRPDAIKWDSPFQYAGQYSPHLTTEKVGFFVVCTFENMQRESCDSDTALNLNPFRYDAGRKVSETVTDAIEKAKLLRQVTGQLVPLSQGRVKSS